MRNRGTKRENFVRCTAKRIVQYINLSYMVTKGFFTKLAPVGLEDEESMFVGKAFFCTVVFAFNVD